MKRKWLIFLVALLSTLLLTGCVSAKKKNQMFEALKQYGYIDVGDRGIDDYDEEIVVDQSPVPVNVYYYKYITDDATYTIDYRQKHSEKEDTSAYRVHVKTERDGEEELADYIFEDRKIIWKFRKMYFVGIE